MAIYSTSTKTFQLVAGESNFNLATAPEGAGADRNVIGNELANAIAGDALNNTLDGGRGDDVLAGGGGLDTLIGGLGDDRFVIDADDQIVENANEGFDTVVVDFNEIDGTYTLGLNFEGLELAGTADLNGTGNFTDNTLKGNAGSNHLKGEFGNDTLVSGIGADRLEGGFGNDVYLIDDDTDLNDILVEEAGGGIDTIKTSISEYNLEANFENLELTGVENINGFGNDADNGLIGNAGNNRLEGLKGNDKLDGGDGADQLFGGEGSDTLIGGAGGDALAGGDGSDTYRIDASDVIIENADEGYDSVYTTTINYTLGDNVEGLYMEGSANLTGIGNSLSNTLWGNSGNNKLIGGAGYDFLYGGEGADTMEGGADSDSYSVNSVGDVIVEYAGGGTDDQIVTLINYTLSAGTEVEHLAAAGTSDPLVLTGNKSNNQITGNHANNTLDGGGGTDKLIGSKGNDTYIVKAGTVTIVEAADEGHDVVKASVSYVLADDAAVEILEAAVPTAKTALNLTGSMYSNSIRGNAGKNSLFGKDGDDKLFGKLGNDVLSGGLGKDTFAFDTKPNAKSNLDKITDFNVLDDSIQLSKGIFKVGKKVGVLKKGAFYIGGAAHDADDRIIYSKTKGALYYDADGSGAQAAVQIATLSKKLKMTYKDFLIV